MVKMYVAGLTLDDATKAPILILRQEDSTTVLPIWIGAMEAMAISIVINDVSISRPLTHDLMLTAIEELGGTLHSVEIIDIEDGTYFAELLLHTGDHPKRMDCRPSDAIALALRADAPIMVAEKVIKAASVDAVQSTEHDPEILRKPEDTAFEMDHSTDRADAAFSGASATLANEEQSEEDETKLSELLRNLEPETKNKM